ncbi:tetratricopeptide repeat protein [Pseudohongiella nitratireducens]|uniref:tetratricopeptide repeat protein n=1 Tax=Pseudohongiella nitratireducens TaxID=1768907 RepID=UPI00240901B4|nr:hypothetical protein [Pseudohongiella nitratireducens]|tara:strand:- start:10021 stop:11436 length:1416 start_codon:yes stop_codon:yes gene_type:complete
MWKMYSLTKVPAITRRTFSHVCSTLMLCMLTSMSGNLLAAEVQFELAEPQWQFLLENYPLHETEATLDSSESEFASVIQPLLSAGDHEAVVEAFNNRDISEDSAALRLLRGQVLLNLRRTVEAESALQSALELMPDLAMAHRSLSMVYLVSEQYEKARLHLTRSIELGVKDAQLYGQLAFANLELGNAASAIAGYQMATFMAPENNQWRQGLLYALINSHAYDQAQGLLEEMIQSDPDNKDLWLQRSQIALNQEREMQALSSMEQAIALGEVAPANLVIASQLHIQIGSPTRAVSLLAENMIALMESDPGSGAETIDQIGAWLAGQENWEGLDRLMSSLSDSDVSLPDRMASRFDVYRAQVALSRDALQDANEQLQEALTRDPANGEALLTLASVLRDQDRANAALSYYVRAEALPMFKERAMIGRAQLEIDRQNYEEALRVLRQIVRSSPNRADIMANIRSLESLVRNRS